MVTFGGINLKSTPSVFKQSLHFDIHTTYRFFFDPIFLHIYKSNVSIQDVKTKRYDNEKFEINLQIFTNQHLDTYQYLGRL